MDRADHGPDGHARSAGAHMAALIEARDLTLSFGPRTRGADRPAPCTVVSHKGPSPRAPGRRDQAGVRLGGVRTIPVHAGPTRGIPAEWLKLPDHPPSAGQVRGRAAAAAPPGPPPSAAVAHHRPNRRAAQLLRSEAVDLLLRAGEVGLVVKAHDAPEVVRDGVVR